jgi:hypothetical protein
VGGSCDCEVFATCLLTYLSIMCFGSSAELETDDLACFLVADVS